MKIETVRPQSFTIRTMLKAPVLCCISLQPQGHKRGLTSDEDHRVRGQSGSVTFYILYITVCLPTDTHSFDSFTPDSFNLNYEKLYTIVMTRKNT